jgi:prepilin peptidase CpaA
VDTAHLYYVPLLTLLVWAAAIDVRARRIPNWLSLSLAFSGLGLAFCGLATISPGQSLLGLLTGLGIGFALFLMGAWAAGDAKLLAGIGAWIGAMPVIWVVAGSAVLGLVLTLIWSVSTGRLGTVLRDGALLGMELAQGSRPTAASAEITCPRQLKTRTLPLAVTLSLATAGVVLFNLSKGG